MADYIPHRDADFDDWFLTLKNYVVEKTSGAAPVCRTLRQLRWRAVFPQLPVP